MAIQGALTVRRTVSRCLAAQSVAAKLGSRPRGVKIYGKP